MLCAYCGKYIEDGRSVCDECGKPVENSEGPYGKTIFMLKRICSSNGFSDEENGAVFEKGVAYKNRFCPWDEIGSVYRGVVAIKNEFLMQAHNVDLISVRSESNRLFLIQGPAFFPTLGSNGESKEIEEFEKVYRYIVSKIIDRQWDEMKSRFEKDKNWSFGTFTLTKEGILQHKLFAKPIAGNQIVSFDAFGGTLNIIYALRPVTELVKSGVKSEDLKTLSLGNIGNIPNFHLVERFLLESAAMLRSGGGITSNPFRNW